MPVSNNRTIAAASGYPQLAAFLTRPEWADGFIELYHATTLAGSITNQSILSKYFRGVGDEVIFSRAPRAEVFEYQKNQELQVGELETSTVTITLGRAVYSNLKLDKLDIKGKPDVTRYVNEYTKSVQRAIAERIDRELLVELPLLAAACNRGPKAGVESHAFNFGTKGAPVILTSDNLIHYLSALKMVLLEQNVPADDLYVVLPIEAQALFFANSTLANACAMGQKQSLLYSEKFSGLFGFDIYFSNMMPQRPDGGKVCYTILAGRKSATGLVVKTVENQHITQSDRHFGEYWRTLTVYDFAVLEPEALTCLYATIQQPTGA